MRVTAKEHRHLVNPITVFLDGVPIRHVLMADDEKGVVITPDRDATGKLVSSGRTFLTKILRGKVEISLPRKLTRD